MSAQTVTFTSIPLWVQVWGLPFDLITMEAGKDIGSSLGTMVDIDHKAFTSDQAHFIRLRVELPLDKPLCQGGVVLNPEGDKSPSWV